MEQTIVDPCIAMYLFLISIFKWIAVIKLVSKASQCRSGEKKYTLINIKFSILTQSC